MPPSSGNSLKRTPPSKPEPYTKNEMFKFSFVSDPARLAKQQLHLAFPLEYRSW